MKNAVLLREIKVAGGNKRWIANDRTRLGIFEDFYKKGLKH
jgi:hypothetical protein